MRCREARQKLTAMSLTQSFSEWDPELRAHVKRCASCSRHARAQAEILQAMHTAGAPDTADTISWTALQSLVERQVVELTEKRRRSTTMRIITRSLTRPAYVIPAVIVVAAFLMLTLTPWKMDDAVGYEVAFAGVDKNLALDEENFTTLLIDLGIPDAKFTVDNCDDEQACQIKITELQSQEDVGKVVTAMYKIGNCELLQVVNEDDVALFEYDEQKTQQMITEDAKGNVICKFIDELSDEYQQQLNVQVDVAIQGCFKYAHRLEFKRQSEDSCFADAEGGPHRFIWKYCYNIDSCKEAGETGAEFGGQNLNPAIEPLSKTEVSEGLIDRFSLSQNYPNPFNASTVIEFNVPKGAPALKLEIFNIRGQLVRTLFDGVKSAGTHQINWDATDSHGAEVASGVYLYRLTAGEFVETKKMSLMR